jgi:hypothetical protein
MPTMFFARWVESLYSLGVNLSAESNGSIPQPSGPNLIS